uniref:Leucine-rich repeat protein n=1 Tax=Pithovirus LCPAC101 TaxID=2506586 RepID=A0A481Z361_9VIRU|nr:MAG: leucine-rich repeat protein [Pithovirus LCPAC101]
MDILESQLDSNIIDDMFIEVCKNLDFDNLLNLQLLSKYNKHLIRKTKWSHTNVKLKNTWNINNKVKYLATNFNFMKYTFYRCDNITDESVKMLGNVHSLCLKLCGRITDESVKMLGNVHSLDLSYCNRITDDSVKMLGNVHSLD